MTIGIALIVIGGLGLFGLKILPIKKNWNIVFAIFGVLLVTGLAASAWSGLTSLAVASPTAPTNPDNNAYSYSVTGAVGNIATQLLDAQNHVITNPVNTTSTVTTVDANFTIAVTDAYADMRGVQVTCNTQPFLQQNVSVSDSTMYTIVTKDTSGLPLIKIQDSAGVFTPRDRTFLLGGQASEGQDVVVRVLATLDSTAIGKLNVYNSAPINCNVAGQQWTLNIQRITP